VVAGSTSAEAVSTVIVGEGWVTAAATLAGGRGASRSGALAWDPTADGTAADPERLRERRADLAIATASTRSAAAAMPALPDWSRNPTYEQAPAPTSATKTRKVRTPRSYREF
jgi:hypothetical protein